MKVLTIAMMRDDAPIVPYFVRHYRQFSDVLIFDDHSTDNSAAIAATEGASVRPVDDEDDSLGLQERLLRAKNHAWKPVRETVDWIIAVDVDEFLYHENMSYVLRRARELEATVLAPCGYQMVSDRPPRGSGLITNEICRGVISPLYSKLCCFNPLKIDEINFDIGGHYTAPTGAGVTLLPYPGLKLLHYHYLGVEYTLERYARRNRTWQDRDRPFTYWRELADTPEYVRGVVAALDAQAADVV
jgi:glycosyltransferase involved in cell wall biosynthesis